MLFLHDIDATTAPERAGAPHRRISRCPRKVAGMAVCLLNKRNFWGACALPFRYIDTILSASGRFHGLKPIADCQEQQWVHWHAQRAFSPAFSLAQEPPGHDSSSSIALGWVTHVLGCCAGGAPLIQAPRGRALGAWRSTGCATSASLMSPPQHGTPSPEAELRRVGAPLCCAGALRDPPLAVVGIRIPGAPRAAAEAQDADAAPTPVCRNG